jgi:hypothetical protein
MPPIPSTSFKNIQTKNRERENKPLRLEFKWVIVASPSKENRLRAFIVKKGPPDQMNSYNCVAALDSIVRGVVVSISIR